MIGPQFLIEKKIPMDQQIQEALDLYKKKYGHPATECYVNSDILTQIPNKLSFDLSFHAVTFVQPNVFWIGVQ